MAAKAKKVPHKFAYVGFFVYLCAVNDATERYEKTNHPCTIGIIVCRVQ